MKYLIQPLKSYLAFLFLLISLFSFSQSTFYWIGGSGNWSDPQHWSSESGGQSVFKIPSKNDAVVFDDLSFFEPFSEIVIANGAKIQLESIWDNTNYTSFEVKGLNLLLDVKESINLTTRADFSAFQTIKISYSKNGKINLESKKLIENLVIENGNYVVNAPSKIANLSINNSTTEVSGLLWANDIKLDKKSRLNKSSSAKVLNFNNQVLNNNFQPAATITNGGISTMAIGDIDSVSISPLSQTICPGTSVLFTATIFGEAPYNTPLTYEWYLTQGSTTLYATHVSNSATDTLTIPFNTGGTVTVFVTDANFNTVISNQSTISVPGVFVSTATQQAVCFGTSTGVATFTLIPNTPGTTFSVDNGPYVASNVATGLSPGAHNVRIITPAGCSGGPFSFNIGQRPRIQIAINSKTNVLCFGGNNGAISVTASGGTGTLSYAWQTTPIVNSQSISNLTAGAYTIRITDGNSCQRDSIITITQPTEIIANEGQVDNLCFGSNLGKFYATPSGGVGPYDFSWYENNLSGIPISNSSNVTTDSITGLLAGLKFVIITDANNCSDTAQTTISEPNENIISLDSTSNPSCFGSTDGFARVVLTSVGTGPATITWSNSTSALTTNTLGNGNHSVFFTDANLCVSNTINFTLTEPAELVASILSSTNVSCNGANDGSGILSITGGTSPYNISWTNTSQTNDTITGLSPNTYVASVTDANGCLASANFTITQPSVLVASASLINNVLCNGGSTGSATANQTGGTGPYNYSWNTSPIQNTQTAVNLSEGLFTVTVTDINGCVDTENITITQPALLNASIGITNNVTCNGGSNGSTSVDVVGGTTPYTFSWNSGQSTSSIANLTAGQYIITVSDVNNCSDADTIDITQPNAIAVTTSQINVACLNQNTGVAIASANGGTGLLSYAWQTTPVQLNDTATGLIAGTYNVIVSDINGCQGTNSVTITQPATALSGSIVNQTNLTCFGANTGTAEVVGSGGTPPYNYSWNTIPIQTTAAATGLSAGTHIATITDANNCSTTVNVNISQPVQINVNVTVDNNVSCFGGSNGQLTASASLGVAPYNYEWNTTPTQNNATATGLSAGSYTVTVVDAANCSSTGVGVITEPTQLTGTASLVQNATCNNGTNGSVIASAANGTAPYNYSWNGGSFSTNPLNQNLSAGLYTVTIRDANNCTITRSATVSEPDPIVVSFSNIQDVLCAGQNTGQATASAIGGSGSYSFSWNTTPVQNTATGIGLGAGTYTVKATDGAGCIDSNTVTINQTAPVTISFSNINNVSCNGGSNGSVQADVAGGTAPYQFIWNTTPAQNTQSATGLSAGNYTVSIIDANTCLASNSVTITQPAALTASTINIQNISCNGSSDGQATASPAGGTAPYNYLWNTTPAQTNQTASGLAPGTYNVLITDANFCTTNTNATITDAQTLVIDETIVNPSCSGDTIGSININITGGTGPFNYAWTDGPTTQNRTNIEVGVYSLIVTDANGCSANESFVLAAPLAITVNNVSTNASCFGEADGAVNLTVSGGTPPYTYSWSNGATTEDLTNIVAGTYCVTVLDANNCRAESFSFSGNFGGGELFLPDDNGVNIYSTNIAVAGYAGSQTIQSTNDILEVCINMEHSFLGDLGIWLECPNGQSVNLKGSPTGGGGGGNRYLGSPIDDGFGPTLSQGIGAEYCFTNSPTFLTMVAQSAIASSLVSTGTPTGLSLPAGAYRPQSTNFANFVGCPLNGNWTLKIKDFAAADNGWIFDWNIGFTPQISPDSCATVTEPAAIIVNATSTNVTCNGANDGTASAAATGGTGTLTYSWRRILPTLGPIINSQNITGRAPGRFVATVTDANGCVGTDTVDITQPAILSSTINNAATVNVSCNGGNNGSLTVVPSGGTTPYTYLWNSTPAQTNATATGLPAGTYSVQVRDANNCLITSNATITQPSLLVATASVVQNVTCNGGSNGSATVSATGGTGTYSFSWNTTPIQTTQTATNLSAGIYTVSVTDANNCLKTSQITITEPLPVSVTFSGVVDVFCEGQNTGQATAVGAGGNGTYNYQWQTTPVQTTATATGLSAGVNQVVVTDGLGCSVNGSVTINQTAPLSLSFSNINDLTCFDQNNGSAQVNVSGGTAPYTYSWNSTPIQNTDILNNVSGGTYIVIVSDNNNCQKSDTVEISSPTEIILTNQSQQNVSCFGGNNGSISIDATGGIAPYTYSWNTTPIQTTANANNLVAGSYTLEVRDANNCLSTISSTITQPTEVEANASVVQNVTCNAGNNGSATVVVTGGTGTYTFSWNTNPVQTTQTAINLTAGNYTVTVEDANGCQKTSSVTITEPLPVTVSFINITPVFCEGQNTGQATAIGAGGNGTYNYQWQTTPVQTTATANNLSFGNIQVLVTDGLGCSGTSNVTITETAGISLSFSNINHLTCFGDNNGSATVDVVGGTMPYNFSWNTTPVQNTATLTNVPGGDYIVIVSDVNSCVKSDTITINSPQPLVLDISNVQNVTCFDQSNGSATILASGGTSPYDYSWNTVPVQTSTTVNNLADGIYIARVTDDNGCITDSIITITEPTQLTGNASIIQNATCNNDADGLAFVSVSGGTLPYSYSWNTNPIQTNDTASVLTAGMKIVTVSDTNNCSFADTVIISEPAAINISFSGIVSVLCQGQNTGSAIANVSGGNGTYTYSWATTPIQTTAIANNLPAGSVALTVTDGNGCSKTESVTIPELNPISISFSNINNLTCFDANNGSAQASVNGGTAPYTFSWNSIPTQNTSMLSNVAGGSYILTVVDANLCNKQDTVEILTPPALGITLSNIQNIGCSGNASGEATATAFGGTGTYSYSWNTTPVQTSATATNLLAGTYIVQVEDGAGCTTDSSVTISQSTPITATILSQQNVNCFGGNNGQAILEVLGGTLPYSISWNTTPIQTNDTVVNLTAGNYTATIVDGANCQQTASVTITEPTELNVTIVNPINNNCFGDAQGEATASVSGGTAPYSIEWNTFPPQTNATATLLEAGTYQVFVSDLNGCLDQANVTITEPNAINISFSNIVNPTCGATGNGSVTANVTGGVTPYTYNWNSVPAQSTATLSNVVGGNYIITITDDNNCLADSNITLVDPSNLQITSVVDAPDCFGDTIGSIDITITGGNAPFTYTWSNGASTEDLINVSVGTYNFNVTDINNCQAIQTFSLQAPAPIQLSSTNNSVSCFGGNDGSVDLAVTGGTPPYNYSWTNGGTTQDLTNVPAGNYCVSVIDANGCRAEGFAASGNFDGGTLFLPDGDGAVYTTSITISDYAPGQTFNATSDLAEICINMEHSFSGDLIIELECPNTQTLMIKGNGGGDVNLGIPVIDLLPGVNPPGTGFEYCWNNNPTFSTLNIEAITANNLVVAFPQNWATPSGDTLSLPPGSYLADDPISSLIGCPLNGVWTLKITDQFAIDNGYIFDWNIGFTPLIIPDSCVNITEPTQLITSTNQNNVSCNGGTNGQASVSASGGTAPYTFAWSNGVNNDTINNLSAGQYIVTVTDFNGCIKEDTVNIIEPQALQLSATSVTNVNCFGDANGAATVAPTGGTAPYSYSWNTNPAQFTSSVNFLTAGTYTATVSDVNNCIATTQVTIGQNSLLQADITLNNSITCFNAANASITLSGNGGATPYTFSWNTLPIQTIATLNNLGTGTFIGTVSDANGCSAKDTIVITQPTALGSSMANQVNVNCFGQNTGSVQVNATGGSAPYDYLWTPGNITTPILSNRPAGTYNVLVTDANGCTTTNSATITQPSVGLSASITTFNNVTCNGGSNGSATVTVIGGTPAYGVTWNTSPVQVGTTASNLSAGTYTATVIDALGCTTTSQVTITQPNAIAISMINPIQPLCGVCNGEVTAAAAGGVGTYTYSWNTLPIQTGATVTGLCPSTNYQVTVADGNGCSMNANVNLNPSVNILLNANIVDPSCGGFTDGSITLSPSGGILPYTYSWSTGQSTENISGVGSGQYIATISDNSGCTLVDTFDLVAPQNLALTINKTDITCNDLSNGQAVASVSGGTVPYSYAWSNGVLNDTITNLNAGNYTVSVTDDNGCSTSGLITINQPSIIDISSVVTPSLCSSANGAIDNTITGGTTPYNLLWLDGPVSEDRTGLGSGIYTLVVNDANGCSDTTDIAVSDSNGPILNISQQNNLCSNNTNGSFSIDISGGIAPYQVSYQGGAFATIVGTNFAQSNLASGNYSGVIRDANSCQAAFSIDIITPNAITAIPTISNETCLGFANGSISLNISGGSAPLNVLWSNSAIGTSINSLSAGSYSVIISDINSCQYLDTFEVVVQPFITATVSTTNVNCVTASGSNTGNATVNIVGGTNPSILWSNSATSSSISGLTPGSYSVAVTSLGCTINENFTITATDSLKINTVSVTNDPCFGAPCDGSITVAGQGGVAGYNYQWIGGPSTATFAGICANNYSVSVTDNVGCSISKTIGVSEPNSILVSGVVSNVLCAGASTGSIDLTATGGTSALSYAWSNGATTEDISNLSAGAYLVTITDATSCSKDTTFIITQTQVISYTTSLTNPSCAGVADGGIDITVLGGTAPYTFNWNNGANTEDLVNITSGTYSVTIIDANLCQTTANFNLTAPNAVNVSLVSSTNGSCGGLCDGSAEIAVSGGNLPYTYSWTGGLTGTNIISNVCPGSYTVSVSDAIGCSSNFTVNINTNSTIQLDTVVNDITCFGLNNGSISVNATGGTGALTISWNDGSTLANRTNLAPGTYTVTISDATLCSKSQTFIISEPQDLSVSVLANNVNCFGDNTGTLTAFTSGGVTPYDFQWNDAAAQTTAAAINLTAGQYTVVVTDANGCSELISETVTQNTQLIVTSASIDATCGINDGSVSSTVSGGVQPYIYSWNNGASTANINNVGAGIYTLSVSDNLGCTATTIAAISNSNGPDFTSSITQSICSSPNGAIEYTIGAGSPPMSFEFNGGTPSSVVSAQVLNFNNLAPGLYTAVLSDNLGCITADVDTVTELAPIIINVVSQNNPVCGNSNGSIDISISGGTTPLNIAWSSGQTTEDISGLSDGTYTITVTDANSCSATQSFTLINSVDLLLTLNASNVTCNNGVTTDGQASVQVGGGTAPYTYLWSNGALTSSISGIGAGNYTVTVTDFNGCARDTSLTITAPAPLNVNLVTSVNPICNGQASGQLGLVVTGGSGNYNYLWNNGNTTNSLSNVVAGTYSVIISDQSNAACNYLDTFQLTQPSALNINVLANVPSCAIAPLCNGLLAVDASGGSAPYTYTWTGAGGFNASNDTISQICAGTYALQVMDDIGCSATTSLTVGSGASIISNLVTTNDTCGTSVGTAVVNPTGGVGPYSVLWFGAISGDSISNLPTGQGYFVTITDAAGCSITETFDINGGTPIIPNEVITFSACGQNIGSISLNPFGGTPPYTIQWNTGASTPTISNLAAGIYTATITDAGGCSITSQFGVSDAFGPIVNVLQIIDPSCGSQCDGLIEIEVISNSLPVNISWLPNGQNTQLITNLCAGTYIAQVTDASGCVTVSPALELFDAPGFTVSSAVSNLSCAGSTSCDGAIDLTITGFSPFYNILWNDASTDEDRNNLCAGQYIVEISDLFGCIQTDTFNILEPNVLSANVNIRSVDCSGAANGAAFISVTGGTAPYQITWPGGFIELTFDTASIGGLSAGSYTVTVDDANNCGPVTYNFTIGEPLPLNLNAIKTDISCFGNADGSISINPTGGVLPYNILWSNTSTANQISGLNVGQYYVDVTDNNGCLSTDTFQIAEPLQLQTTTSVIDNVTCFGGNDGKANITINGGTAPYFYQWSPNTIIGATNDTISQLIAGTYTVTITDANNCTSIDSVIINQPTQIIANFTSVSPDCNAPTCDGSIFLNPTGGNPGVYTYNWINPAGQTNDTLTGLCAGLYNVIISDVLGCEESVQIPLSNFNGPVVALTKTDVTCFGDNNGTMAATSVGTAPFTYLWSPLALVNDTITNLGAGIYVVQVTDNDGCLTFAQDTILEPNQIQVSISSVDAACGISDGSATATASGGVAPFSYVWSNNAVTASITNLAAGNYGLTVTDATGCSLTLPNAVNIQNPNGPTILGFTITDASCNGLSDGSATVTVIGGTGTYLYQWTSLFGQIGASVTNLSAGTYPVQVSDANGCVALANAVVNEPPALVANPIITFPACGLNDGSIALTPATGNTYNWSSGLPAGATQTGLGAGVYSVYISNASTVCTDTITILLNNPAAPVIQLTGTDITCNGSNNGQIILTTSGGTAPINYLWNNGSTNDTISGLSSGLYTVEVTDGNGCIRFDTLSISEPPAFFIGSTNILNAGCGVSCDAEATVFPSGGVLPYLFNWSVNPTQVGQTATGLCAGQVVVSVTDANGCLVTSTISINPGVTVTASAVVTNTTCGACNGEVTVSGNGGSGTYNFVWFDGNTNATRTGLCPGNYSVQIIDNTSGCSTDTIISISSDIPINETLTVNDVSCNGAADGSATVTIPAGTQTYTIFWSSLNFTGNSVSNLSGGVYPILITDQNGCQKAITATINEPSAIALNEMIINPDCGLNNGSISVNPTGGVQPYVYDWSTGGTTNSINNLGAGLYTLVITQANSCVDSLLVPISNVSTLAANETVTNVSCFNQCNGSIGLNVTGGTNVYNYAWNNGAITDNINGLCEGTYSVIITDANDGCQLVKVYNITQPDTLLLIVNNIAGPICGNLCEGTATAIVSGGTTPYTFAWSNGENGSTAFGLCSGNANILITDQNGCTNSFNFIVPGDTPLELDTVLFIQPNCANNSGTLSVIATGGTGPYGYQWSGASTSTNPNLAGINSGFYQVVVIDANLCSDTLRFNLEQINALTATANNDSTFCGDKELVLTGTSTGGATNVRWYDASNGVTLVINDTLIITPPVGVNVYVFEVSQGTCFARDTVVVTVFEQPLADAGADKSIKFSESTTIGGSPTTQAGNLISWSPNNNITSLTAANPTVTPPASGYYYLTVTSGNGCIAFDSVFVEVIPLIEFPNGFTPNSDGINDFWLIDNIENYPNALVEVYSRWGEKIFSSIGYKTPWDGKYNGQELPVGTYYYIIDLKDGEKAITGPITIMR